MKRTVPLCPSALPTLAQLSGSSIMADGQTKGVYGRSSTPLMLRGSEEWFS